MRFSGTPLETRLRSTAGLGGLGSVPDSPTLDAVQLQRIQAWLHALNAIEASTNELLAERTRRMTGAQSGNTDVGGTRFNFYRIPTPASGCPATGNFELSFGDIFEAAKVNLRALGSAPPPRWTGGRDVVRWFRAIQWCITLLRDATNVRRTFLWPNAVICAANDPDAAAPDRLFSPCVEQRVGSTTTLFTRLDSGQLIEGMPYPCGSGHGCGAPESVKRVFAPLIANGFLGFFPVWNTALDWLPPSSTVDRAWMNAYPNEFRLDQVQAPGVNPGAIIDSAPVPAPGMKPASRYFDDLWRGVEDARFPARRMLDLYAQCALLYAQEDMGRILADSIGWWFFNHVTYWKNRGVITIDSSALRSLQQAAQNVRVREGLAVATGTVRAVVGAVNPIAGAIAGVLTEIGFAALGGLINLDVSGPVRLFMRNYPASCAGVEGDENLLTYEAGTRADIAAKAAADAAAAERAGLAARIATNARAAQSPQPPWLWIGGGIAAVAGLVLLLRR